MKTSQAMSQSSEKTVREHLRELKRRLILSVILMVAVLIAFFIFSGDVVKFLFTEGEAHGFTFISLSPQEVIVQELSMSLVFSVFTCLPFFLWQIMSFATEPKGAGKISLLFKVILVTAIFLAGAFFSYKIMIPFMFTFFKEQIEMTEVVQSTVSVEKYIGFYIRVLTIFGLMAEAPVFTSILAKAGLLTDKGLKKAFPIMIIVIFILAAVITPPDVISQLMVAIPMLVIYAICIAVGRACRPKARIVYSEGGNDV